MKRAQSSTKKVSDLKSHTGFWLRFVSNHVSHRFGQRLEAAGVTVAEWVILREMFDGDITSPSILASETGLTRGAVSKLIDRLLRKKLVTRAEAMGDRRFQDIALTTEGRAVVPRLAAIADENDEDVFHHLSTMERTALVATLKKLVSKNNLGQIPVD